MACDPRLLDLILESLIFLRTVGQLTEKMSRSDSPWRPSMASDHTVYKDTADEPDLPRDRLTRVTQSTENSNVAFRDRDDIRERERDLLQRTSMLEDMVRALSAALKVNWREGLVASTSSGHPRANESAFPSLIPEAPDRSYPPQAYTLPSNTSFDCPYSEAYIRYVLELIPKYDGHGMPVWQFIHACKRAKDSISLINKVYLVSFLKNKLTGHALKQLKTIRTIPWINF